MRIVPRLDYPCLLYLLSVNDFPTAEFFKRQSFYQQKTQTRTANSRFLFLRIEVSESDLRTAHRLQHLPATFYDHLTIHP